MSNYEVQHMTLCDGWVNCWLVGEGEGIPQTFDTIIDAQAELDEMFQDIEDEIKSGARGADEGYSRVEYRIVPIGTQSDDEASISSLDESREGFVVSLFSSDFTRTLDVTVTKTKLSRMKTSSRYNFISPAALPLHALNAVFVQLEKELEK